MKRDTLQDLKWGLFLLLVNVAIWGFIIIMNKMKGW